MVSGCPELSLDQTVLHLRSIASLRELETNAPDAAGLVLQAERLLETVGSEPEFELPVLSSPAVPSSAVGAAGSGGPLAWIGPFDPLDGSVDIEAEIKQLLVEEPGLNLPGVHERLRAKFPHLFKTAQEVADLNKTLPSLATGVYEQQKSGEYELVESKAS
jgi:hypothetical protein